MLNLVLVSENEREKNILTIALEQQGFKVYHSETRYESYVFVQQFLPDIILIEMPYNTIEQLNFTRRVRSFKKTAKIPIVAYGNTVPAAMENGMRTNGVSVYINRPLKFGMIMRNLEHLLRIQKKTLKPKAPISEKEQDIALLLNSDALPTQKIDVMVRYVSKLIAFPFTVAKVLKITQDEKTGAGQLAKAVNADPYMVTYLLKVANSVFFASANRRISTVQDAIVRIGFNETKRIVLGMSIMKLFDKENKNNGFDRVDFWYHSLAAALIAERIAKNMGNLNLDEVFLAGLLHDFGIILFDDCFPSIFETILEETSNHPGLFYDHEIKTLKVSHLDMIGELFPQWRIPQIITESVKNQYGILNAVEADTDDKKFALCISLGNQIAKLMHLGKECDQFVTPVSNELMHIARLTGGLNPSVMKYVQEQLALYVEFLGLDKRSYKFDCPGINPTDITVGICNVSDSDFLPLNYFFHQRAVTCEVVDKEQIDDSYDNKYHLIICWSTEPVEKELREKLMKIPMNPSIEIEGAQNQFAPLIEISPHEEEDEEEVKENRSYARLSTAFDYRIIEMKISSLLSPGTTEATRLANDESGIKN